jgi:DNA-binding protein H-NS
MKAMTNEQLEALIAKKEKALAETKARLEKQKKTQKDKEDKEIVSLIRSRFKTLDAFKEYLGEDLA